MESNTKEFKPLAYGAVIFITLGITVANETLSKFGMEGNYVLAFSVAFLCAALLLAAKPWLTMLVLIGVALLNLPLAVQASYHLDRDVLLAAICAVILVPTVYDLLVS